MWTTTHDADDIDLALERGYAVPPVEGEFKPIPFHTSHDEGGDHHYTG